MAFNLTGVDEGVYFKVSTFINASLFSFLVLPPFLLCLLCVLALIFATDLNIKIRVVIINIFAAEVCGWLSYTVFYLGFPPRILQLEGDYSCNNFIGLSIVSAMMRFLAGVLYAIIAFVFIKYGEKRIKWYAIIPYITATLLLISATVGIFPYFEEFETLNVSGFCVSGTGNILFKALQPVFFGIPTISIIIIFILGILLFIYIRKNVIEENREVKKAIVKVLIYLTISSVLNFINGILPIFNFAIRQALLGQSVFLLVGVNYLIRIIYNLPNIATPIAAILLLKPICTALKVKLLFCFKNCNKANE